MIQTQTQLKINDNTGIKKVQCINVYKKKTAKIGDLILISVKKIKSKLNQKHKTKKGDMYKSILIRSKFNQKNYINNFICFNENSAIILNNQKKPLGTRILGPVPFSLRKLKQLKVLSLASTII